MLRQEDFEPVVALPSEELDTLMSWSSRAELFHRRHKEQALSPSENLELITTTSPPSVAVLLYDASVIPVGGTVQPELPNTLPFHIDAEAEGSDNDSDTEDATEDEGDTEDATFSTEDLDSTMAIVEQLHNLNMLLQLRTSEHPEGEDDGITAVPGTVSSAPVAFDHYLLMARMRHNGSRRTPTLKLQSDYHEL
jgi:hypothetical protein